MKISNYFESGRRKITSVEANEDFTLTLTSDNDEIRLLDLKQMIATGTVFEFLCDIRNFKRVYLDEQHCVSWDIDPDVDSNEVWNNKVDLCPDTCYLDSILI